MTPFWKAALTIDLPGGIIAYALWSHEFISLWGVGAIIVINAVIAMVVQCKLERRRWYETRRRM